MRTRFFPSAGRKRPKKAFGAALELRPEWTLALASLGSVLVGKGQFAEAEKLLTKAVALDDANTLAYSALTELRLRTNAKPDVLRELLDADRRLDVKSKTYRVDLGGPRSS